MKRSLFEITLACGGRVVNCENDIYVDKIVNNDKECVDNCLYVSLRGERFDGDSFVSNAVKRGASAVLTSGSGFDGVPCVIVPDTESALGMIAGYYRKKELSRVIAVTGSAGKTTVKEMIAAVLSVRGEPLKTDGNKNNLIGLPLTLLSCDGQRTAVVEAGISLPGEMENLSRIAAPDLAVITSVGHMHAQTLGGIEGIAREKSKIALHLQQNGAVIVQSVDLDKLSLGERRVYTVGQDDPSADFNVTNRVSLENESVFDLHIKWKRSFIGLKVPMLGRVACVDGAFAAAVGVINGLNENEVRLGLMRYKSVGQRQNILYKNGLTVFSDCYNSGPEAATEALYTFNELVRVRGGGKRVILLGSMLELGQCSQSLHVSLGKTVAELGADALVTYGELAKNIALGAMIGGLDPDRVFSYTEDEEAEVTKLIERECNDGFLFIKGSRAMRMERFIPFSR